MTAGSGVEAAPPAAWVRVCEYAELTPGRGVAALVGGEQVAIFLAGSGEVYAVGNLDPFSGAYVMSRGILGSVGAATTVASPMYKQAFDLATGVCLDDAAVALPTYPVEIVAGEVRVGAV